MVKKKQKQTGSPEAKGNKPESASSELDDKALDKVAGGRRASGPGDEGPEERVTRRRLGNQAN